MTRWSVPTSKMRFITPSLPSLLSLAGGISLKNPETVLKTFNPDVRQMSHPPAGKAASRRNLQHATDRAGTQAPLHPRQGPPQHQKPAGGWRLWDLDAHSCNLDPIIIQYDLDLVVVHQTTRPRN